MSTGIRLADDLVDARLIESLVAVVSLEDFQVRSERPFRGEPLGLLGRDEAMVHGGFDPTWCDRPQVGFGESLFQVREISKRPHRFDAELPKLLAGRVEVEAAFQVMHACFEKRFTLQFARIVRRFPTGLRPAAIDGQSRR